jgi:hypothetical protein
MRLQSYDILYRLWHMSVELKGVPTQLPLME